MKGDFRKAFTNLESSEKDDSSRLTPTFRQEAVWSVRKVAMELGVSEGYIYKLRSEGKIPYYKRFGRLYFLKSEIFHWIKDGSIV